MIPLATVQAAVDVYTEALLTAYNCFKGTIDGPERLAELKKALIEQVTAVAPEHSVPYSRWNNPCLDKSGDAEPLAVLCGRDSTAPEVWQFWIDLNVKRLGFDHPKIVDAVKLRDALAAFPSHLPT